MKTRHHHFKTRAAFRIKGQWRWHSWTHNEGNKHKAIRDKARELGADNWDWANADHGTLDGWPAGTP